MRAERKPQTAERRLQLTHVALATARTHVTLAQKDGGVEKELLPELEKLLKFLDLVTIKSARLLYQQRTLADEKLKAQYEKEAVDGSVRPAV